MLKRKEEVMMSKSILHSTLLYFLACFAGLLLPQEGMAQNGQGGILDNPPMEREGIKSEHQIMQTPVMDGPVGKMDPCPDPGSGGRCVLLAKSTVQDLL
jgi:hypothetical protein